MGLTPLALRHTFGGHDLIYFFLRTESDCRRCPHWHNISKPRGSILGYGVGLPGLRVGAFTPVAFCTLELEHVSERLSRLQTIVPKENENFQQYSVRCHKALFEDLPDPFERNQYVRNMWRSIRGATDEDRTAESNFDGGRYTVEEDVCIFAEHETTDSEGNVRAYGLNELLDIAENCNNRIVERRAFAAISDGHTGGRGQDQNEPRTLGYTGPYNVGLIGSKEPTWAIFAREHRDKDAGDVFDQKRRRSVELWTDKRTGKAWFDPIAVCGTAAPRLPLPTAYAQVDDGDVTLEKYTCGSGFASVGATSTHIKKHDRYTGDSSMLTDNDEVQRIVDAILATPQMQWVSEQMNQVEPGPGENGGELGPEDMGELDALLGEETDTEGEPGTETLNENEGDMATEPTAPEGNEEGKDKEKYTADHGALVEKYSALESENTALRESYKSLADELSNYVTKFTAMEQREADAKRRARWVELASECRCVDVEEECKATLYSMGAEMTDDAFDSHFATVEKYARKQVDNASIPGGSFEPELAKEDYEARLNRDAVKIATEAVDAGKPITYREARKLAEERLSK